ncbi:SseB family protein [Sphaerisporangium corydalis]|uniref:SseB family protein n=1 Tax=Sphaerisporangium corydalis TaxID=1441875 RepID=A0ABV9E5B6_9ACTN|nr:SseB family protein [Sphaerisporangium corydalis]
MREWEPSSPFEEGLGSAFAAGDLALCLGMLRSAEFALPIGPAASAGQVPVAWPTVPGEDRTWIAAYTSEPAMRSGVGAVLEHRIVSMAELAAGWPDLRWGLAVNPGLPVSFLLEPGTVARLAVPSLAQDLLAEPGSGIPVVQKLLRPADLYAFLADGVSRVSGYCHHALDVAHIATPTVLADALGHTEQEGVVTEEGSVNILRWRVAGPHLYRTPYGGTDEETMAAVAGWVIEEPPFVGMGLVPNVDQLIREYKVDGVGLPHGAEIRELTASGVERRRAVYDGDLERWMLVQVLPYGEAAGDGAGAYAQGGPV